MSEVAEKLDQAVRLMGDREGKYLTFSLAHEESFLKVSALLIHVIV